MTVADIAGSYAIFVMNILPMWMLVLVGSDHIVGAKQSFCAAPLKICWRNNPILWMLLVEAQEANPCLTCSISLQIVSILLIFVATVQNCLKHCNFHRFLPQLLAFGNWRAEVVHFWKEIGLQATFLQRSSNNWNNQPFKVDMTWQRMFFTRQLFTTVKRCSMSSEGMVKTHWGWVR